MRRESAYDSPISKQRKRKGKDEDKKPGIAEMPSEEGCLREGLYYNPEKAQFGPAEGRQSQADDGDRSHCLYPRCGAQPSGTFDRHDTRWKGQGPPRRQVSYYKRHPGFHGSCGPETGEIKIRLEKAKIRE